MRRLALPPDLAAMVADPALLASLTEEARAHVKALTMQHARLTGAWLSDPVGWVRHQLNGYVTRQQSLVLEAVRDHARVLVPAGHSVGKSKTVARLALWWVSEHPPGEAMVITTAPTFPQVRAIIWREMRMEHRAARLPGKVNQIEWVDERGDLVAFGRKPSDYDVAAFQGIHAPYVLVIIDEASGVDPRLWDDTEKLVTGPQHRLIAIGNPDHQGSHFHKMTQTVGWHTVPLSVLDSPNLTGEECPPQVRMALASREWVDDRAARFGIGSPSWQRQVTGEFPAQKEGGLIPRPWLQACAHPERIEEIAAALRKCGQLGPVPSLYGRSIPRVQLGVDVAAGGGDKTVVRERRDQVCGRAWEFDLDDSEQIVDEISRVVELTAADRVVVDSIGVGFGVLGGIRRRFPRVDVQPFNAAEAPEPNPDPNWPAFKNKRSQLWWMGRELSRTGQWDTTMLLYDERGRFQRDDPTVDDLCAPTYEEARGFVVVESKEDITDELGRSPDYGEATLMSFWTPGRMRSRVAAPGAGKKTGWNI